MIYLDNSMAAKPSEKAISEMMPWLLDKWGALESPHTFGQEAKKAVKESLTSIYRLLSASLEDTVLFTSSAEAINHVMMGVFFTYIQESGKNHIIVSALNELPSYLAAKRLEELGCSCKVLEGEKRGFISKKAVEKAITPRTVLVSLSLAHGLTGVINPLEEIASLCKERDILLHIDVTHGIGKIFLDLNTLAPAFVTFRGEPLHGPSGTGILHIKKGVKIAPLILGGQQQLGLRGGSFSIPNAVGLGVAAKELLESRDFLCTEIARIRTLFEERVLEEIPQAEILFSEEERVPHITAIAFPYVANEILLYHLNQGKIFGCIGGGDFLPLSNILRGCQIAPLKADTAISFSLSRKTEEEDVLKAAKGIKIAYDKLLKTSKNLFNI